MPRGIHHRQGSGSQEPGPFVVREGLSHAAVRRQNERTDDRRDEGDDMGIDDLVNQGKEFLDQNKDQIQDALKSEQAEGVSDGVLDAAADFVKKVAPDSIDQHVDGVRDSVDKAIGDE
jgi:hypothetical protein